eukprot:m.464645 g.464645  ORF g.464645 m.464645 type:complete len:693 (+) comp21622_c0_seq10:273-2351(+)
MTASNVLRQGCVGIVVLFTFFTIARFLGFSSTSRSSDGTARGIKTLVEFGSTPPKKSASTTDSFGLYTSSTWPSSASIAKDTVAVTQLSTVSSGGTVNAFNAEVCLPTQEKSDVTCNGGCGDYRSQYVNFGPRVSPSSENGNNRVNGRVDVASAEQCCEICFHSDCTMYIFNVGKLECYLFSRSTGVSLRPGQHTIGRILRDASWSPQLHYTTEIAKVPPTYGGKRHDERCNQDGCDFLYPMAASKTISSPEDLPMMPSTCMKFLYHTGEIQLSPISTAPTTSVIECRTSCIALEDCIAWTHDAKAGTCTLFPALEKSPARTTEKHCTTGVVRAGMRRLQQRDVVTGRISFGNVPPQDQRAAGSTDLTDVDVPVLGQCIRGNCLDVHHCAKRWRADVDGSRFAFVVTDDLRRPANMIGRRKPRSLQYSASRQRLLDAARAHNADVVILVPEDNLTDYPISADEHAYFEEHNIRLRRCPWAIPPQHKARVTGCSAMDLIRLNAFRLEEYDAIILYDADVTIFGDVSSVFKCAAQNYLLTTTGPLSPLNLGFVALKPNTTMVRVAEYFLARADFVYAPKDGPRHLGGWDSVGYQPTASNFVGGSCGQGLLWALFYKNGERNTTALLDESWTVHRAMRPKTFQLDRCIWNYQCDARAGCGRDFKCTDVRSMHKKIRPERDTEHGDGCFYYPWNPK